MDNYFVDVSVYASPISNNDQCIKINKYALIEYIKRIEILYEIIIVEQPRYLKYYLYNYDINFLLKNNLDLTQLDNNFILKSYLNSEEKILLENAKKLLNEIYKRVPIANKYIEFKSWFKILYCTILSKPILQSDVLRNYFIDVQKEHTKNNIAIVAALNNYIYKNTNNIKLVLGCNINCNIDITTKLKVFMDWYDGKDMYGEDKYREYIYKIKNFPEDDIISLEKQNISTSTLDVLKKIKYNYSWKDNLSVLKFNFKNITFINECDIELEIYKNKIKEKQKEILKEYKNKINKKRNTEQEKKDLEKIKKWKKQCMEVIYRNLYAIDIFLDNINKTSVKEIHEHYNDCKPGCINLEWCGSHIRYFGVDCVDETYNMKNEPSGFVKKDRTINNNEYWLHLKIFNISCKDEFWYFSLRIHFRWIANNKIEIGSIGRHRYLPCEYKDPKTGLMKKKCYRKDCRINPDSPFHNKAKSDYENLMDEWL